MFRRYCCCFHADSANRPCDRFHSFVARGRKGGFYTDRKSLVVSLGVRTRLGLAPTRLGLLGTRRGRRWTSCRRGCWRRSRWRSARLCPRCARLWAGTMLAPLDWPLWRRSLGAGVLTTAIIDAE